MNSHVHFFKCNIVFYCIKSHSFFVFFYNFMGTIGMIKTFCSKNRHYLATSLSFFDCFVGSSSVFVSIRIQNCRIKKFVQKAILGYMSLLCLSFLHLILSERTLQTYHRLEKQKGGKSIIIFLLDPTPLLGSSLTLMNLNWA